LSAHFVAAASTMGFLRWWPELCSFSIAGKSWLEVACKKSTKDDALIHQVFFLVCLRLLLSCICCGPSVGVRRRLDPFRDLASFVPQIGCGS
jgi:hypothetical protein